MLNLTNLSATPWLISYRGKVWLLGTPGTRSGDESPDLVLEAPQDSDPASAGKFRGRSFDRTLPGNEVTRNKCLARGAESFAKMLIFVG